MTKKVLLIAGLMVSGVISAQQLVWTNTGASADLGMVTTYNFAIYDDGAFYYQDPKYARLESLLRSDTFKNLGEFANMINDVSLRKSITTEQYTLTPIFGAVQVQIKNIPHTYTLTPYVVRLIKKDLAKHLAQ